MEISDALVTAITREILRRLQSGELKLSGSENESSGNACPESACKTQANGVSLSQGRRRVISEAELMKLCPAAGGTGQSVEIGSRDIVTPLAEDYISKMRITVNRVG